jgi:C4-dicarboxylate-specific signal transduction histidine kinase
MVAIGVFAMSAFAVLSRYVNDQSQKALTLERAKVLQSSKLASIGEMAAGIAHELNTPLGAIMLNVEMTKEILNEGLTPSVSARRSSVDLLNDVEAITERMSAIILGLKAFGRDSQHEPLVSLPLSEIVRDALTLCGQRFKTSGARLQIDDNSLQTVVPVRRVQIVQTVLNLLNNAFDATADLDVRWLRIEAVEKNDYVSLLVTDSGSGISDEAAQRLFEPFFTTKEYGHGTGLGLSISKGIALEHGGDLHYVRSSAQTQFSLDLPKTLRLEKAS